VASSLIGGYHLAFAIGAASIAVGVLTARVVLRTAEAPAATQTVRNTDSARYIAEEPEPLIERQAA